MGIEIGLARPVWGIRKSSRVATNITSVLTGKTDNNNNVRKGMKKRTWKNFKEETRPRLTMGCFAPILKRRLSSVGLPRGSGRRGAGTGQTARGDRGRETPRRRRARRSRGRHWMQAPLAVLLLARAEPRGVPPDSAAQALSRATAPPSHPSMKSGLFPVTRWAGGSFSPIY